MSILSRGAMWSYTERTYRPAFRLRSALASFCDSANLFACQARERVKLLETRTLRR